MYNIFTRKFHERVHEGIGSTRKGLARVHEGFGSARKEVFSSWYLD